MTSNRQVNSENISKPLMGIFNDCFPPIMDGVSVTTQNYAYWLHQKKANVCVVTPKYPFYKDNEPYPVYRYSSIPIPLRKPYRMGFPRIDWTFNTKLNQLPFELVHAHCPFSSGELAMRIAKENKIPIVATFHSKYKADFERIIPNKFIIDRIIRNIIRFYEMADEVWIPQASVEETLREYGYKGPVEVVDNGNDYATGQPLDKLRTKALSELNILPEEFVFLFVGQHIWEKNIAFIIESLSLLQDVPFKMFFVGTGYAEKEIKQKVKDLNLSSRVIFTGMITNRNELKKYYTAADLFLFPSLYDNAPLVVREAAALLTPSILIEGSTASEIITHESNGFLVSNSPEAFANQIRKLTKDPILIHKAGINASKSIARTWENVSEEVLDRYTKLKNRICSTAKPL